MILCFVGLGVFRYLYVYDGLLFDLISFPQPLFLRPFETIFLPPHNLE